MNVMAVASSENRGGGMICPPGLDRVIYFPKTALNVKKFTAMYFILMLDQTNQ